MQQSFTREQYSLLSLEIDKSETSSVVHPENEFLSLIVWGMLDWGLGCGSFQLSPMHRE